MNEIFWKLNMPGSEVEIVCINLETGEEEPAQMQLFGELPI